MPAFFDRPRPPGDQRDPARAAEVQIQIRISRDDHEALREIAHAEYRSISAIARRAIHELVETVKAKAERAGKRKAAAKGGARGSRKTAAKPAAKPAKPRRREPPTKDMFEAQAAASAS